MAHIRILPEILSNQIAAGEVVQRPASVVKELVENSIDAGATRITVEIEKGGKSLIRISDNGCGLQRDEALLSIERYATSKIFTTEDLFSISTFGFRGEALPSIASISRFCLVSRTSASNIGTRIEMSGGKLVKVSDMGAPVGTLVEVKQIFYNTPARRKFLKSENTETSHIADAISGLALGNPHVGFRLFVNKKLVKNFPSGQGLFQRSLAVLGKDVADRLYGLEADENNIRVSGACSSPMVTRSTSSRIYLFVNHRLVYDRGLVAAVFQGYKGRIMKGRFPMGVVRVELPYDQVDVNVHPSKREIKFLAPQPVYQAVALAVGTALAKAQEDVTAYSQSYTHSYSQAKPVDHYDDSVSGQDRDGKESGRKDKGQTEPSYDLQAHDSQTYNSQTDDSQVYDRLQAVQVAQSTFDWEMSPRKMSPRIRPLEKESDMAGGTTGPVESGCESDSEQETQRPITHPDSRPHILGQVLGTYIIAEKDNNLVMIDQHAAHERIVYEALKKRHEILGVQSQDLLVPEVLDVSHREADRLTGILEDLSGIGLRIEPFGGTTFVIKAIPSLLEEKEVKPLVLEIIETLMEEKDLSIKEKWLDSCLTSMACHRAIRANKPMNTREMEQLLEDLEGCDNPMHCPHGRPTLVTFDSFQLQKLFKRLV